MPVNIVIASPQSGDVVQLNEHGTTEIRGYAVPQGSDGPVMNFEVSVDDCKTWNVAKLGMRDAGKLCWVIWKLRINIPVGVKKSMFNCLAKKAGNDQVTLPTWKLRKVSAYNEYGESRN
ncbi:hypothetical protein MMC29_006531 [Sticta canariensis]|nr:hypothetical protein [Sticta canariensis]